METYNGPARAMSLSGDVRLRTQIRCSTQSLWRRREEEVHMESPVVRPADSIRELRNGTGAVLLDMGRGTCYSMNPAGARIWQLLRLNYSSEQIVDALA